jgi:dihydrodipicolinate synthase/N-acetylneuraminate lyase
MLRAFQCGDLARANELYARLTPLIDAIFRPPVRNYRARVKEGLRMQGILSSAAVRPPLLPISDSEREEIRAALESLGLLAPVAA